MIKFLGSVQLAISLLILLTLISVIGVLIPQNLPPFAYIQKWGEILGKLMLYFGIDHIFSTSWFYLLMTLLALNTLFCSFSRIFRKLRVLGRAKFLESAEDTDGHRNSETFLLKTSRETVIRAIIRDFRRRLYRCAEKKDGESTQVHAHNGGIKEICSLVFHLSLVLLMIGGVAGRRFGFSYQEHISQGASVPVRDRDFSLRCDWFKLETNERGEISDYKSKLTILNNDGSEAVSRIIEVNHPLDYQGIKFYQSSYRFEIDEVEHIRIRINGPGLDSRGGAEFPLRIGKPTPLAGTNMSALAQWFIGDFAIDMKTREIYSRSPQPNNPAVKILLTKDLDTLYNSWTFMRHPDFHPQKGTHKISLLDFTSAYSTGITIKKDPEAPLVWVGILLMSFSMVVIFTLSRKRRWVFIEDAGTDCKLICISDTEPEEFKRWTGKMIGKLERLNKKNYRKEQ